eukprot:scaffold81623_cov60-Phaeocystis_antarctica.AAC.5
MRASSSATSRRCCCITPLSSVILRRTFSPLWYTECRFQAPGFPGQLTQHQYVVGTLYLTHFGHTGCFSRSSSISDGIRAQPKQARLGASDAFGGAPPSLAAGGAADTDAEGTPPSPTAGGGAAVASVALLSAFSAVSASRTSLVPAPRAGCCSRSLASSGLRPSSGSASHSPRTVSRRASAIVPAQRAASYLPRRNSRRQHRAPIDLAGWLMCHE